MKEKLNREELAAIEIGVTTIKPHLAAIIVISFLLLIFSVPLVQNLIGTTYRPPSPFHFSNHSMQTDLFHKKVGSWNNHLLEQMDFFEDNLEESSVLRQLLLGIGQRALLTLGYGNEKVYVGKNQWLFHRPGLDYLFGPPFLSHDRLQARTLEEDVWLPVVEPDPFIAINDFNQQLIEKNIRLILVPTPVKGSLHPEFFTSASYQSPLQNRSWGEFVTRIKEMDILLFDPAPELVRLFKQLSHPVYLMTDTHWRVEGMLHTAQQLASFISKNTGLNSGKNLFIQKKQKVQNRGDINAMLLLSPKFNPYPKEKVTTLQVINESNELWQPDPKAEILLLGDSFSNIYSLNGMGWGAGGGLAEQLSYFLQQPVDVLSQNDGGSFATRELLAKELARGNDRLAGKKVVIWQFATRELAFGNWKKVKMELGEKKKSSFFVPEPNDKVAVQGVISAISRSPVPGSVPYKDNIITLHITDLRSSKTKEVYGEALVYCWGMRDNVLTELAQRRIGDSVHMILADWESVQSRYSSYRRSTLDDQMIELELPTWGEVIK